MKYALWLVISIIGIRWKFQAPTINLRWIFPLLNSLADHIDPLLSPQFQFIGPCQSYSLCICTYLIFFFYILPSCSGSFLRSFSHNPSFCNSFLVTTLQTFLAHSILLLLLYDSILRLSYIFFKSLMCLLSYVFVSML